VLRAHGRSLDGLADEPPQLTHDQPVLASCYATSAADLQLLGDTAGQRTLKLVQAVRAMRPADRALAEVGGVNIHAEVAFDGRDRLAPWRAEAKRRAPWARTLSCCHRTCSRHFLRPGDLADPETARGVG